MTASEVVMKRDDPNIAWGFRLTGGADLGTPFYVVKVLGRGHAERAGLRVGDMVYAINHKYINKFTHKDAQNAILHTGDTLILNIRRGPADGKGTPLPEYADPLMGIAAPPPTPRPKVVPLPPYEPPPPIVREPTPPESEEEEESEETVAAFNIKINPKGRIAAIEELPVTPSPSRSPSRCRSRSRSMSRDRRGSTKRASQSRVENGIHGIPGPGEAFTYSKEVVTQYSTVLSASDHSGGQTSETINESFIIHGGSEHKMEDVLSPDDIEKDIFEEKMEEQKITELLTGEAEVLDKGIVGINFQKIMPKTSFIKDSNVFKELQEQCIKKEEPEEEQLKKDPTKRFSTFLQTPKRPIPKPKTKPPPTEDLPWKKRLESPLPETLPPPPPPPPPPPQNKQQTQAAREERAESSTTWTESVNIIEEVSVQEVKEVREERVCEEKLLILTEEGPVVTDAVSTENISEEKVHFKEETDERKEETCSIEECKEQASTEERKSQTSSTCNDQQSCVETTEYKSEFERQLAEIRKQLETIQQLPNVLQANLTALQDQLTKIVEAKVAADQKENEQKEVEEEAVSNSSSTRSSLKWKIDVAVEETKECEVKETTEEGEPEHTEQETGDVIDTSAEAEALEELKSLQNEQYENMKNLQHRQREDDESSVCKPPMIRNFPRTVAERPIVLPGGRKWYTPRDAYNEDFIAETIINQSEVLVGSTIGLNFRKYEPPKFDASNSAVYRLVQELENRCSEAHGLPIEVRPEKVLAEQDYCAPISKRHFFAARLAEQANENVEKILLKTNEQDIISV